MSEVKLIPVYYKSIVTGWGCACCLHTIVGEGRARKEILNSLPGPKSSLLYVDIVVLGLLLAYIFVCLMSFSFTIIYIFHDLIVNFLIPLYVNIYLVYSLSFINFGGLGSFLTYLLTCGAVVLILVWNCAIGL